MQGAQTNVVLATTFAKGVLCAIGHCNDEFQSTEIITTLYKAAVTESKTVRIIPLEQTLRAAHLAFQGGADDDTILVLILRYIGHLLPEVTHNAAHVGAQFLNALQFPGRVCKLVELSTASDVPDGAFLQKLNKMKIWDEAVTQSPHFEFELPPFETYSDMMQRAIRRRKARENYERDGYVLLPTLLNVQQAAELVSWVNEIQNWTPTPGKWMTYYEKIHGEEKLCRTENFLPFHEGLRNLLTQGELSRIIAELFGSNEEPCVFKEKINYKLAGGAGFPAHQDAPAFTQFGQKNHLTLNIAIDNATPENGCLEVSPGFHKQGLFPQDPVHNGITKEAESKLPWISVPMKPGDVLLFSSYLPHRSGPNTTQKSRRALYVTYNAKIDGDFREIYYNDKRQQYPQKVERIPGKDYSLGAKIYNLATPISS